jgi:hypothetical protein
MSRQRPLELPWYTGYSRRNPMINFTEVAERSSSSTSGWILATTHRSNLKYRLFELVYTWQNLGSLDFYVK